MFTHQRLVNTIVMAFAGNPVQCRLCRNVGCYSLFVHVSREFFFFFQAEDGIRATSVTGVQTCALPILRRGPMGPACRHAHNSGGNFVEFTGIASSALDEPAAQSEWFRLETNISPSRARSEIGRASCRERV